MKLNTHSLTLESITYTASSIILPLHSSVAFGRSSHTGRVPSGRRDTAIVHSLGHTLSLKIMHSSLSVMWRFLLVSHNWNIWRHRNGFILSEHSELELRKRVILLFTSISPSSWSMAEGMLRAGGGEDTPEKHVCREESVSKQISPE